MKNRLLENKLKELQETEDRLMKVLEQARFTSSLLDDKTFSGAFRRFEDEELKSNGYK